MCSESIRERVHAALTELEEAVYEAVLNYNYVQRCLTEDHCRELDLTSPNDIEIVRHIFYRLKEKGLVDNLKSPDIVNDNAWHPTGDK